MFNKKKGAQITIFLLLGIVLISVFSVVFFVISNSEDEKDDENKQLQYSDLLQKTTIKSSIDSCFDAEIIKSLNNLGLQGGAIYEDQGGNYDVEFFLNFSEKRVNYAIKRRDPNPKFFPLPVPDYPYLGKLNKNDFPYFGKDYLPGLCDPFGSNKDCPSYDMFNKSFEKQLMVSVINGVKRCMDNTLIHMTYPAYNITVSNEPNISISFGEKNTIFDLDYEIRFEFADGRYLSGLEKFKISKDVRLKHIHNFIKELITHEIKDVKFDIVEGSNALKTFKPGFKVSKVVDACGECTKDKIHDDIIKVLDEQSSLGGESYEVLFARQNRIPALDLIKLQGLELETRYDYRVKEGDEIIIEPVAYDADEETASLVFEYKGWKEDENVVYNIETGDYDDETLVDTDKWSNTVLDFPNANYTTGFDDVGYHNVSVFVKDRQGLEDYQIVKILVQDIPRFKLEGRHDLDISYQPHYASIEDPYTLKATVQCIFCESKEQFSKTDLSYRFFHITDGYNYDAEPYKQIVSTERLLRLEKDINNPFSSPFSQSGDQVRLFLPEVTSSEVVYKKLKTDNVFDCWPEYMTGAAPYPYHDSGFGESTSALLVKGFQKQGTAKYYISLDKDKGTSAPNVCCGLAETDMPIDKAKDDGWKGGKFLSNSAECFNIVYDTCNPKFLIENEDDDVFYKRALLDQGIIDGNIGELKLYQDIFPIPIKFVDTTNSITEKSGKTDVLAAVDKPELLNDIFERKFVQKCSGTRGNACSGEIEQVFTYIQVGNCSDKNITAGEDETCFGPSRGNKDFCSSMTSGCNLYSGESLPSFEKNFLQLTGQSPDASNGQVPATATINGICNEKFRFASLDEGKFKEYGNWLCQAQCGIGGCTKPYVETCVCDNAGTPCYQKKLGEGITICVDGDINDRRPNTACMSNHCESSKDMCPNS